MFYFENFPTSNFGTDTDYTDLKFRISILPRILERSDWYDDIELVVGDTIETIAYRLYGSPSFSWVILLSSPTHPLFANFKQEREVLDYCKQKYAIQLYDIHHYEDENGNILDEVDKYYKETVPYNLKNSRIIPVTNYEYESRKNYERRVIRVLKPTYLPQLLRELESYITQAKVGFDNG